MKIYVVMGVHIHEWASNIKAFRNREDAQKYIDDCLELPESKVISGWYSPMCEFKVYSPEKDQHFDVLEIEEIELV